MNVLALERNRIVRFRWLQIVCAIAFLLKNYASDKMHNAHVFRRLDRSAGARWDNRDNGLQMQQQQIATTTKQKRHKNTVSNW